MNKLLLIDCMEYMKTCEDNAFALAIVDPPYGIGWDGAEIPGYMNKRGDGTAGMRKRADFIKKQWDKEIPSDNYFDELFQCSKNQIIWGGNYFKLPPTKGIICWDKDNHFKIFSHWEYAWTSFNKPARLFKFNNRGWMNPEGSKIHPTQKPVALYKWLLQNYAKPGDKILDTHVGSGSSRIACHEMGFDFIGYEIDEDYWQAQEDRFYHATRQKNLFDNEKKL